MLWRGIRGERIWKLREVDFGFGFYDEEGVGVGVAGGAEFLAGVIEGIGLHGEDDAAVLAADEIEAALLLDELELGRHARRVKGRPRRSAAATLAGTKIGAIGSIHGIG